MKKILLLSNGLFLMIIIFLACKTGIATSNSSASNQFDKEQSLQQPASIYNVPDVADKGMVGYDLAVEMSRNYVLTLPTIKVGGRQKHDAGSVEFTLETLKAFISKIETAFPVKKFKKPPLGIRFYFIRYPADVKSVPALADLSAEVGNHQSLMMVPYYINSKQESVDFNIDEIGPDPSAPLPYYLTARHTVKNILLFDKIYYTATPPNGGQPLIQNHGGITPPPDNQLGLFPSPQLPTETGAN